MKKGDHIYVDLGSFKQHGIYCGNDSVIYLENHSSTSGNFFCSSLAEFSQDQKIKIRKYQHKCTAVEVVIKRAERRLKETKPKYKFDNSKAFAIYCKTGLKVGDHIWVNLGSYSHHGIYYSNDKVIHYRDGKICLTSLKQFSGYRKIKIERYKKSSSLKKVIRRAKFSMSKRNYNLFFNNCEHFATWCKTGRRKSKQIEKPHKSSAKFIRYHSKKIIRLFPRRIKIR